MRCSEASRPRGTISRGGQEARTEKWGSLGAGPCRSRLPEEILRTAGLTVPNLLPPSDFGTVTRPLGQEKAPQKAGAQQLSANRTSNTGLAVGRFHCSGEEVLNL